MDGPISITYAQHLQTTGIPTLGICFGHQLLCHSYGGKVERHDSLSSGIWELELTKIGKEDKLLTSHLMPRDTYFRTLHSSRSCDFSTISS